MLYYCAGLAYLLDNEPVTITSGIARPILSVPLLREKAPIQHWFVLITMRVSLSFSLYWCVPVCTSWCRTVTYRPENDLHDKVCSLN